MAEGAGNVAALDAPLGDGLTHPVRHARFRCDFCGWRDVRFLVVDSLVTFTHTCWTRREGDE